MSQEKQVGGLAEGCGRKPQANALTTADVLRFIGRDGVVVGSVAAGAETVKDVDVVVRPEPTESDTPCMIRRLIEAFRPFCESDAPGHLWVHSTPLPVEVFSTTGCA